MSNVSVADEEEETQTPARIKRERSSTRAAEKSESHVLTIAFIGEVSQ